MDQYEFLKNQSDKMKREQESKLEKSNRELKEEVEKLKINLGRVPLSKWFEYGLDADILI